MIIYFNDLLDELSEVRGSDVIGVWGTTYALITAFVLITVWTHFNDTDKAISNETKALIALWNNTDYLEDDVVSAEMNKALLEYSNMVVNDEISEHRRMNTVEFPKTEFIQIMKVIDKVELMILEIQSCLKLLFQHIKISQMQEIIVLFSYLHVFQ